MNDMLRDDVPDEAPTLRSTELLASCSSARRRRAPAIEIVEAPPMSFVAAPAIDEAPLPVVEPAPAIASVARVPGSGARRLAGRAREVRVNAAFTPVPWPERPSMIGVIGKVVRAVGAEALGAIAAAARPRVPWI